MLIIAYSLIVKLKLGLELGLDLAFSVWLVMHTHLYYFLLSFYCTSFMQS